MTPMWVCAVVILLAATGRAAQDVADLEAIKSLSREVSQHLETSTQNGREMEQTSTAKEEELDADKESLQTILSTIPSSEGTDETPEIQTTLEPEPEMLPTPVPETGTPGPLEVTKSFERKKKPSVPKKEVNYNEGDKPSVPKKGADPKELKPSVHARKEADPTNGTIASEATMVSSTQDQEQPTPTKTSKNKVVPRKDADPKSLKPSVYARKEADPTNATISEATMQSSNTELQAADVKGKDKISELITSPKGNAKGAGKFSSPLNLLPSSSKKPTPALISDSKGISATSEPQAHPIPVPIGSQISSTTKPPKEPAANATLENHNKPEAAIDDLNAPVDDSHGYSGAYAPAAVAIVLLLCIVITVLVLVIRKVQDVWMKRHYARMDFLIDGMYDM